jgi:hypothetical protein
VNYRNYFLIFSRSWIATWKIECLVQLPLLNFFIYQYFRSKIAMWLGVKCLHILLSQNLQFTCYEILGKWLAIYKLLFAIYKIRISIIVAIFCFFIIWQQSFPCAAYFQLIQHMLKYIWGNLGQITWQQASIDYYKVVHLNSDKLTVLFKIAKIYQDIEKPNGHYFQTFTILGYDLSFSINIWHESERDLTFL